MTTSDTPTDPTGVKGKAQRNDEDALLLLALISLGDIEQATIFWRRLATDQFKGLIVARSSSITGATSATSSAPGWNAQTMAYVNASGVVVPAKSVRAALLAVIVKSQDEALRETAAMLSGAIELAEWQQNMFDRIKRLNLAAYSVGLGGRQQITADQLVRTTAGIPGDPAEVATIGDVIAYQYGRMQRFAEQVEKKHASADTPGEIEARVKLYNAAAYPTFEMARAAAADAAGMDEELNVLSAVEHCQAKPESIVPDCPSQTRLGWVPRGTLAPIGRRLCGNNCRCSIEYRHGVAKVAA